MSVGFPLIPPNAPLVFSDGRCTSEWYKFFLSIQKIIGGPSDPFEDMTLLGSGVVGLTSTSGADTAELPGPPVPKVVPDEIPSPSFAPLLAVLASATTSSSGSYTPTVTGPVNIAASTSFDAQWLRVGNVVTVSGRLSATATAIGAARLTITLPVASNLAATEQCAGTAAGADSVAGAVFADAAGDRAFLQYNAPDTAARNFWFSFTYRVI